MCAAGQSGYNMAPVREVLLAARNRYHDLLSTDLEQLAAKAVTEDNLQHVSGFATVQHAGSCVRVCAAHSIMTASVVRCASCASQSST